jgi:hypothetical protein
VGRHVPTLKKFLDLSTILQNIWQSCGEFIPSQVLN